jgi:putative ABC transport system permease protein
VLYIRMAWRNLWRNSRRSFLTMGAVAFATVLLIFMLSLQFGNYAAIIDSAVRLHTGHLQVQAKGYMERRDIRLVVPQPQTVAAILERLPGVTGYTFRASAFALVSSKERTYGTMVTGIGDRETTVSSLTRTLRQGRFLSSGDGGQALIGSILSKNLQVKLGDEVAVLGQAWDGSVAATVVRVKGIISSGQDDFDRTAFYLPLPYFQEVFAMGDAVHEIVVAAKTLESVPQLKLMLSEQIHPGRMPDLKVLDWKELTPGLMEFITFDMISCFLFYFVLIIVVAFSILNTFFMAIFERKREFGVMMALGSRPGRITLLLSLESMMMTALGSAAGIIIGCVTTVYFQTHGIAIPGTAELARLYAIPARMFPSLSLLSLTIGAALVLGISLLTAVVPIVKVRRLRVLQAMEAA